MRRVLRLFLMCLFIFPSFSFSYDNDQDDSQERTIGSRRQDLWIMDVIGVAVRIRKAEEDYERFNRECREQWIIQTKADGGGEQEISSCKKAEESSAAAKQARRQYQLILDQAALASVPVDWLRAHYSWVRWGAEWNRTNNAH